MCFWLDTEILAGLLDLFESCKMAILICVNKLVSYDVFLTFSLNFIA